MERETIANAPLETVPIEGAGLPAVLTLVPRGPEIVGIDHRRWKCSDPQAVVDAFNARGREMPIDLEHSTEIKGPKGEAAPAVGWIKRLAVIDGAIAAVEFTFTDKGRELVTSRAYRFLSPAILYAQGSREITEISSVGLTNKPNFDMPALNRRDEGRAALCRAAGLAADVDEGQLLARLAALRELERAFSAGSLAPAAELQAALNRASSAEKTLADFNRQKAEAAIIAAVDSQVCGGKVPPAAKQKALALCRQVGPDLFLEFCSAMPEIGGPSKLVGRVPSDGMVATNRASILAAAQRAQSEAAQAGKQMPIDEAVMRVTGGVFENEA